MGFEANTYSLPCKPLPIELSEGAKNSKAQSQTNFVVFYMFKHGLPTRTNSHITLHLLHTLHYIHLATSEAYFYLWSVYFYSNPFSLAHTIGISPN